MKDKSLLVTAVLACLDAELTTAYRKWRFTKRPKFTRTSFNDVQHLKINLARQAPSSFSSFSIPQVRGHRPTQIMYFDRLVHLVGVVSGQHSMVSAAFFEFSWIHFTSRSSEKKRETLVSAHGFSPKARIHRHHFVDERTTRTDSGHWRHRLASSMTGVAPPSGREIATAQLTAAGRRRERREEA